MAPASWAADHLVRDAADRADLAVGGDGAGARDELRAVEVAGGELVDDGEAEHQAGRRPADVGEVEVDENGAHGASSTATPRKP